MSRLQLNYRQQSTQKSHFKSDWHRYNLKQQLRRKASITEDQFASMTGDLSSISGSDDTSTTSSDDDAPTVKPSPIPSRHRMSYAQCSTDNTDSETEDDMSVIASTRRHPKVFLRNNSGQLIALYRCILNHKKRAPTTPAELLSLAERAKTYTKVAVVMLAGGHFSAAIFNGAEAVVHKTFHRYVVRAKRGFVQSVRDSQGSAPKSGGASLRRYNEAALALEIQELLKSWSEQLASSHLIFLRTSTYSRHIFFGGKSPVLRKDDERVRTIPFSTGRPTFNEAKRVHQMLMSVECFGDESLVTDFVPISPARHLHPDTGQLVVRPNRSPLVVPQDNQAKDRKPKGKRQEKDAGKDISDAGQDTVQTVCDANGDHDSSSEAETELIEEMTEIQTDHLQEFAISVNKSKRNKKRKKKKESETVSEGKISTSQSQVISEAVELNEEDTQIKNKLYTCCKSGDVTQLTLLLSQLQVVDQQHGYTPAEIQQPETPGIQQQHQCYTVPVSHIEGSLQAKSNSVQDCTSEKIGHESIQSGPSSTEDGVCSPAAVCDMQNSIKKSAVVDRTGSVVASSEPVETNMTVDSERRENDSRTVNASAVQTEERHTVMETCATSVEPVESSAKLIFCGEERSEQRKSSGNGDNHSGSHNADNSALNTDAQTAGASPPLTVTPGLYQCIVLGSYGERKLSLLHVASAAGHTSIVTALLEAGCDPAMRDCSGKTAYSTAASKDVRNAFRRFRGVHPDRYDYVSAQIPSALTADMEADRKQREQEKKKSQRKARQERLKDKKAEETKTAREQQERNRFLALSDREKRALAAEKRLLNQACTQGGATPVLSRCFQCGQDITGKVPYEYMQFLFCTPKCLKEHRLQHPK